MNRVLNKLIKIVFILLVSINIASALEEEYKNTLEKVELIKTGDSSYNVNLYTQKEFSEPVKVIKKSDLNYYILLPETKNLTSQTSANSNDIRSISTNLYPYAGSKTQNGYTKININTAKPINFTISAKQNKQKTANKNTIAQTNTSQGVNKEVKPQKKNSDFQNSAKVNQAPKQIKKQSAQQVQLKEQIKKEPKKTLEPKNIIEPKKAIEPKKNEPKKAIRKEQQDAVPDAESNTKNKADMLEIMQQEIEKEKNKELANNIEQNTEEPYFETDDVIPQPQEEIIEQNQMTPIGYRERLSVIKNGLSQKLVPYGIGLKDLALMILAGTLSFVFMLSFFTRKSSSPKLKSRSDLLSRNKYNNNLNNQKGQYFIFDKNVRQNSFYNSAGQTRRNYELSSYDPELRNNYKRKYNPSSKKKSESEYDIIQKILKEDSYIEINPNEFQQLAKVQKTQNAKRTAAKSETVQKQQIKTQDSKKTESQNHPQPQPTTSPIKNTQTQTETQEPKVLSKVEIAPERGFMCISYNNNINLMGYIFDDVFALHNFKKAELSNYEIQYRLTDTTPNSGDFIVKIDDTKLLIRVTRNAMSKEVVM